MAKAPEYTVEQLVAIARNINKHLPASSLGPWQVEKGSNHNLRADFKRGEFGFHLGQVHHGPNEGRLCVSGDYGYDLHRFGYGSRDPVLPTRTFAHDRPVEKIAGDIIKLFLPGYYEAYGTLKGRKLERDETIQRVLANAKTLIAASGGLLRMPGSWKGDEIEIRFAVHSSKGFYVRQCYTSSSQGLNVELASLPMPVANMIVAVLGEYERNGVMSEEDRAACDHPFTFGPVCMSCGHVESLP
jgi:hypothetical protein